MISSSPPCCCTAVASRSSTCRRSPLGCGGEECCSLGSCWGEQVSSPSVSAGCRLRQDVRADPATVQLPPAWHHGKAPAACSSAPAPGCSPGPRCAPRVPGSLLEHAGQLHSLPLAHRPLTSHPPPHTTGRLRQPAAGSHRYLLPLPGRCSAGVSTVQC